MNVPVRRHTLTEVATSDMTPTEILRKGLGEAIEDLRQRGARSESDAIMRLLDEYRADYPEKDCPTYPQVYSWLIGRRKGPGLDVGFRFLSLLVRRGYC